MAEMIKTVEHLASEIGPRPVATEEEQQAALYIAREFEELGLPAEIEEFQGSVSHKKTRLLCSALAVILALVSLFVPVIALPAVIVSFICAVFFMSEELGKPILSKFLDKGISQNVVARYVPPSAQEGKGRRRKVVLVARTDSGSVRPELNPPFLAAMPVLAKAARIGMVVLPVFLLIRSIFFLHSTGVAFVITTILLVVICLAAALPAISFAMEKASGLNDGANSSASGIAVMLEVARRITQAAADEQPVIHGAQEAYEQGVVPEGAQLIYEEGTPVDAFGAPLAVPVDAAGAAGTAAGATAATSDAAWEPQPVVEQGASQGFDASQAPMGVQPQTQGSSAAGIAAGAGVVGAAGVAAAMAVPAAVAAGAAAGFAVDAMRGEIIDAAAAGMDAMDGAFEQEAAAPVAAAPEPAPANEVPSWFSAGLAAARRKEPANAAPTEIKRSTFAMALEAAEQRLDDVSRETSFLDMDEMPSLDQQFKQNFAAARAGQKPVSAPAATVAVVEPVPAAAPTANAETAFSAQSEAYSAPQGVAAPATLAADSAAVPPAAPAAAAQAPAEQVEFVDATIGAPTSTALPEIVETVQPASTAGANSVPVAEPLTPLMDIPSVEASDAPAAEQQPAEPAPISMDYFMAAAVGARTGDTVVAQPVASEQSRQPLTLPDLSVTGSLPVVDIQKQRAPLAEAEESGETAAKSLLTMIPSINAATPSQADLRTSLPSLSGMFERVPETQTFESVAGATGSFAPVTEALTLDVADEEELFVDDVDDSAFEENYTETGAYAGPEYVDMPKKRGFGIFDKLFSHKKKEEQAPAHSWGDDDDSSYGTHNAAAHGAWDSYSEEDSYDDDADEYRSDDDYEYDDDYDVYDDSHSTKAFDNVAAYDDDDYADDDFDYDDNDFSSFFNGDDDDDRTWKGGAFSSKLSDLAGNAADAASRVRGSLPGGKDDKGASKSGRGAAGNRSSRSARTRDDERYDTRDQYEYEDDYRENDEFADEQGDYAPHQDSRAAENEEYARVCQLIADRYGSEDDSVATGSGSAVSEGELDAVQQRIEDFRAGGIDTEVWFVALGAETDCHAGMEEFIEAHRPDLRGAIVIELDSLGAGALCTVAREGILKPVAASSRMKRYAKHASQVSGVPVDTTSILWQESAASTALRNGLQAMHLVGTDGAKPALYAQANDVADNIDPEILAENANFVVEVVKGI